MQEKDSTTIRSEIINKAINYIFDNIDENITVDDVAKHCSYSKYHLMRMFKEDTEEALYQFIKRIRLERSAWRLKVEKDRSITEIGADSGYSPSNFATAFKKHLNVSPVDFRKISEQLVEESSFSHGISIDELEETENLITVEQLDIFFVLYERKKGNYNNLPKEWCEFIKKYEYLSSAETIYMESTIDNPSITDGNSVADLLFYVVMLFQVLPFLWKVLSNDIWCAVMAIIIVRISAYLVAAVKYHQFVFLHTYLNKLTGVMVFFIPFLLVTAYTSAYCIVTCVIAIVAALEELAIHFQRQTCQPNIKSIFQKER